MPGIPNNLLHYAIYYDNFAWLVEESSEEFLTKIKPQHQTFKILLLRCNLLLIVASPISWPRSSHVIASAAALENRR
jgi:hypothetical protein